MPTPAALPQSAETHLRFPQSSPAESRFLPPPFPSHSPKSCVAPPGHPVALVFPPISPESAQDPPRSPPAAPASFATCRETLSDSLSAHPCPRQSPFYLPSPSC